MIDSKPGFGLPLVYHLMQQGVLDLGPCVPRDVTPADGNIECAAGPDLHRELPQAGAHAAREPDRDLAQGPAKVLSVQPLVKTGEPVQEDQVPGASPLARERPRPGWGIRLNRKRQKLTFGCSPQHSRNSRIQESDNRREHSVRSRGVSLMDPQDSPIGDAEHDGSVGMGNHSSHVSEAEHGQAIPEQQVQWPTRCPVRSAQGRPAVPLSRFPAVPLSRLAHSP